MIRHGSCHCGAVRFQCAVDLASAGQRSRPERPGVWWTSTFRCNCSFCRKTRFWKVFVRAEDFRLLAGEDVLSDYRFGEGVIDHRFCRRCGVHPFASATMEPLGGAFHAVNVGCLDELTPQLLAAVPITYEDGHNDDWYVAPGETRYL